MRVISYTKGGEEMGNKLSEYRKRKNMTQEELSIKSGVSRKTISDLEGSVEKNTTSKTLLRIAQALDATVDENFFTPIV